MGRIQTVVRVVSQQNVRRSKDRDGPDHDFDVAWKVEGSILKRMGAEAERVDDDCGNLYSCGRVYAPSVDTVEVYRNSIREVVQGLTEGQPGMVVTWGCGKAGTALAMQGRNGYPGLVPFAITDVFTAIQQQTRRSFLVRLSFGEILELADGTEDVRDLLEGIVMRKRAAAGSSRAERQLLDKLAPTRPKGHPLRKLSEHVVCSASQALLLLSAGWERPSAKDADAGHSGKAKASANASTTAAPPPPVSHPVLRVVVESVSHDEARPSPGTRGSPAPDWLPEKHALHGSAALVIVGVTSSTPASSGDGPNAGGSKALPQHTQSKAVDALLEEVEDRIAMAGSKPAKATGKEHPSILQQVLQPALEGAQKAVAVLHVDLAQCHVPETQATLRFGTTLAKVGALSRRIRHADGNLGHGERDASSHDLGGASPAIEAFWEEIARLRQVLQRQRDRKDGPSSPSAIQGQMSDLQHCIIGGPPSALEQHGEISRLADGTGSATQTPESAPKAAATMPSHSHDVTPGPMAADTAAAGSGTHAGEGQARVTPAARPVERPWVSSAGGGKARTGGVAGGWAMGSFRAGAARLQIASVLGLVRQHERCAQCLAWQVWRGRVREAKLERAAGVAPGGAESAAPIQDSMEATRHLRARLNAKDQEVAQLQGELEEMHALLSDAVQQKHEAVLVAQELGQEVARLASHTAEEQGNTYTLRQKAELLLTMIHAEGDKERCTQLVMKAIDSGHVDRPKSRLSRDGEEGKGVPHGKAWHHGSHAHGRGTTASYNAASPEPANLSARDNRPRSAKKSSPAVNKSVNFAVGAVSSGGKYKMPWDASVGMGVTSAWPLSGSLASRLSAISPGAITADDSNQRSTGSAHASFSHDARSPSVTSKTTPGRTPPRSGKKEAVQGLSLGTGFDGSLPGDAQMPASPREIASTPYLAVDEGEELQDLLQGELSEEQLVAMVPPDFFKSKWDASSPTMARDATRTKLKVNFATAPKLPSPTKATERPSNTSRQLVLT